MIPYARTRSSLNQLRLLEEELETLVYTDPPGIEDRVMIFKYVAIPHVLIVLINTYDLPFPLREGAVVDVIENHGCHVVRSDIRNASQLYEIVKTYERRNHG